MIRTKHILSAVFLFAAVFGIYAGTAAFGLVNIDDYEYLVRSKAIAGGLSAEGLDWCFRSVEHAIWMPLTWISYMIDFSLFGSSCWGEMHLHSAFLHALNSLLLAVFLASLLRRGGIGDGKAVWIALAAAGFWAFHPLRVESVAWLSSRKDVLSFTFELLAFICWTGATKHNAGDVRFHGKYLMSLLFFGLGAMAKPSVMTFPVLQACVDMFICRRMRFWMYIIPGLMMLATGIEASVVQAAGGATADLGGVPLFARILNAMSAFGIYVTNTFFPAGLAPQCMSRYPELPKNILPGIVICGVSAAYLARKSATIWGRRAELFRKAGTGGDPCVEYAGGTEWFLAGFAWFVAGIGPFLGIANFGYHAFADRFTYIPAVGLLLAAVPVFLRFGRAALVAAAVLLPALWVLSWRQSEIWKDDHSVWAQTLKVDGERNVAAHGGLGLAAFEFGHDIDACCRELARVRELNEGAYWNFVQVHVFALCEAGRLDEAEEALRWYRKAMSAYSRANSREEKTPFGTRRIETRLDNLDYAEIAYDICTAKDRKSLAGRISGLVAKSGMTPSAAYLIYRLGEAESDRKLKKAALEELDRAVKTDFLQFRYLKKENET